LIRPKPVVQKQPVDERVFVAVFSPDASRLVTAGGMRAEPAQLKIWDVPARKELASVRGIRGVRTVAFYPDGKAFLTGDFAGNLKVRDADTGAERKSVKAHASGVNCIAFAPDGQSFVTAGLDGLVKLWDANGITERKTLRGHSDMVYSAAFFRTGDACVTGGKDNTARIWDLKTGKEKHTLRGHKAAVEMVAISPDDQTVATASWDGSIRFWNAETGAETGSMRGGTAIMAVAFTRDGKQLLSAGGDGAIRLWDVNKRELVKVIGRHATVVWSLEFSRDGQYLASGSFDTTAKLWDARELKELATLRTAAVEPVIVQDGGAIGVPNIAAAPKKDGNLAPSPVEWDKKPAVVELLEDGADFFIDNLDNPGANDASVAARSERTVFSGTCALSVTPFQRFAVQLPGWNFKIAENPGPGEYRYLRFAWNRTEAPGIMLQIHARPRSWHRYYAGTLSPNVQSWGTMIRVADEPPRKWELVTRDLFKDFGPMTITGVGFTALEGGGEAFYDHIYLGRTIEDLDGVTQNSAKPAPVEEVAAEPDGQPTRRHWALLAVLIGAGVVVVFALVLLVTVIRRNAGAAPAAAQKARAPDPDPTEPPVIRTCAGCGKKLKVKPALAGKNVRCPQCRKSVSVPDAGETS
jgi:hypothetical protein